VRLIHRNQDETGSLAEGDCYDHSYGEHVLDSVDVVDLEHTERPVVVVTDVETPRHVSTAALKRQFEERLAARGRRRRAAKRAG
jgi:hypothetical protein